MSSVAKLFLLSIWACVLFSCCQASGFPSAWYVEAIYNTSDCAPASFQYFQMWGNGSCFVEDSTSRAFACDSSRLDLGTWNTNDCTGPANDPLDLEGTEANFGLCSELGAGQWIMRLCPSELPTEIVRNLTSAVASTGKNYVLYDSYFDPNGGNATDSCANNDLHRVALSFENYCVQVNSTSFYIDSCSGNQVVRTWCADSACAVDCNTTEPLPACVPELPNMWIVESCPNFQTPPVASPLSPPVSQPVSSPVAAPMAAPVAAPMAAPVANPVAAPVAAPKAAVPVGAPVEPTKVSLIIDVVVSDSTPFNNTEAIKQAVLAALPGVRAENVIIRIIRISKKRATYQIIVDIIGTTTVDVSSALNSTSTAAIDALKSQVGSLPGVTSVPGVTVTVSNSGSPTASPTSAPVPAAAPKTGTVSSAAPITVSAAFIIISVALCFIM